MNTAIVVFLAGVGLTLAACVFVVVYLRTRLEGILVDLCGTLERAKFWAAFSNVALILMPIIFAMSYQPVLASDTSPLFELSNQLRLSLIGLVGSVLILGFIISRFLPSATTRRYQLAAESGSAQPETVVATRFESGGKPTSAQAKI